MVITTLALAALQLGPIQYAGMPQIKGADLVWHKVIFTISSDGPMGEHAHVEEITRFAVAKKGKVSFTVPMYSKNFVSAVTDIVPVVMMDKTTLDSTNFPMVSNSTIAPQSLKYSSTVTNGHHTLDIQFDVPAARTGLGQVQRTFAYDLGSGPMIPRLEFIFHYTQQTVFNMPYLEPTDWNWQSGKTGTYILKNDVTPNHQVVFFTYYSAQV